MNVLSALEQPDTPPNDQSNSGPVSARPFLKWPGGKRRLVPDITSRMPTEFGTYFEPFIGGGAVFFSHQPPGAFISDFNPEVVNVYNVVKHKVEDLIVALDKLKISKDDYMRIRAADRQDDFVNWSA